MVEAWFIFLKNRSKQYINNLKSSFFRVVFRGVVDDVPPVCHSVPPALWCSCKKLAKTCGYTAICDKYAHYAYNEKIHITIYYESLCPDCQHFITENLKDLYQSPLVYLARIELVPYGNAKQLNNGTIECQHGKMECYINRFESCALHYIKDPVPFIACLEAKLASGENLDNASHDCYQQEAIASHIYDQINHCVNNILGDELQMAAAKRTAAAWPDVHTSVPWMLFNNVSIEGQQFLMNDLKISICEMYIGKDRPNICNYINLRNIDTKRKRIVGCPRD